MEDVICFTIIQISQSARVLTVNEVGKGRSMVSQQFQVRVAATAESLARGMPWDSLTVLKRPCFYRSVPPFPANPLVVLRWDFLSFERIDRVRIKLKKVPVFIWLFSALVIAGIAVAMAMSTVFIVRPIGLTSVLNCHSEILGERWKVGTLH